MTACFNLMTVRARRRQRRRALGTWCLRSAGALAVVLALVGMVEFFQRSAVAAHRKSLEAQYEPLQRMVAETRRIKKDLERTSLRERTALALAEPRSCLTAVGALSAATLACNGQVMVTQFRYQGSNFGGGEGAAANVNATLRVLGMGTSGERVGEFARHLRELKIWTQVDVKSTTAEKIDERVVHNFELECIP